MGYTEELDALGRWVYGTAGIQSHRLSSAPPAVARPVILWEGPNRRKGQDLGNYSHIRRVSQYGTLYVDNLDQLAEILDKLEGDLAKRNDLLPVYANDQAGALQTGWLKKVEFDLNTTQSVNIPIVVRYEVIQDRPVPEEAPPAATVVTKLS
jgi:hypothetical protein